MATAITEMSHFIYVDLSERDTRDNYHKSEV